MTDLHPKHALTRLMCTARNILFKDVSFGDFSLKAKPVYSWKMMFWGSTCMLSLEIHFLILGMLSLIIFLVAHFVHSHSQSIRDGELIETIGYFFRAFNLPFPYLCVLSCQIV